MSYPEHCKLRAVRGQSQTVAEFLDWLCGDKGVELSQRHAYEVDEDGEPVYRNFEGEVIPDWPPPGSRGIFAPEREAREKRERAEGIRRRLVPSPSGEHLVPLVFSATSTEKLLAEYFDIDLNKLEEEKRAMLDECRKLNEKNAPAGAGAGKEQP